MEPENIEQSPEKQEIPVELPENASIPEGKEDPEKIVLNEKHEEFIHKLIIYKNATKAYREVYPDSSEEAARVSASRLLTNDNVIRRYKELTDPIKKIRKEILSAHLHDILTFNISDLLDKDGNIDKKKIKENALPGVVTGFTTQTEVLKSGEDSAVIREKVSFKLADQLKAVELLAKIEEIYKDKLEVTGENIQIIVGKPRLKDGESLDT